jgi:hypothetical protein
MTMTIQISQEVTHIANLPSTRPVGNASGLLHARISTHVVGQGDETIVQYREILIQHLFGGWDS